MTSSIPSIDEVLIGVFLTASLLFIVIWSIMLLKWKKVYLYKMFPCVPNRTNAARIKKQEKINKQMEISNINIINESLETKLKAKTRETKKSSVQSAIFIGEEHPSAKINVVTFSNNNSTFVEENDNAHHHQYHISKSPSHVINNNNNNNNNNNVIVDPNNNDVKLEIGEIVTVHSIFRNNNSNNSSANKNNKNLNVNPFETESAKSLNPFGEDENELGDSSNDRGTGEITKNKKVDVEAADVVF